MEKPSPHVHYSLTGRHRLGKFFAALASLFTAASTLHYMFTTGVQMSFRSTRTDNAHDIRYPSSADARGSTRINYKRRPYYMGPYDSPSSYIMFGLWKHRLLETGEAPTTKELRAIVQHLLHGQSPLPPPGKLWSLVASWSRFAPSRPWARIALLVLMSTVLLTSTFLFGSKILSRDRGPQVDQLELSEVEKSFIRGLRAKNLALRQTADSRNGAIAALTVKFKEEGLEYDAPYKSREGF
ncbi:MAG: hypothetical protein KDA45_00345 [Planctomycetales bacterium]|nr:hypothetical protein [Planctomycetales bacterium]